MINDNVRRDTHICVHEYYNNEPFSISGELKIGSETNITFGPSSNVESCDEMLIASRAITIEGTHNIEHTAFWRAHSIHLEGTACAQDNIFIAGHDVYFDGADITASHIYVLDTAHIHCSNDSHLSTQIEYVSFSKMLDIYDGSLCILQFI